MSVKIRMSRTGAKKRPFYRIVVTDTRNPRDGRFIERVGTYNPMVAKDHPDRVKLDPERIKHWLSVGARPSDRVARFLGEAGIAPMPPKRNNPEKAIPKKERKKAEEEAKGETKPKAKSAPAEEEAPAAEEAPAEEVKAEEAPAEEPKEEAKAEEAPAEEEKS